MKPERTTEQAGSPAPDASPRPARAPTSTDPAAERDARRSARSERRGPSADGPAVMIPSRRKRLPLEAPLMRLVATTGIVGIAVAIAAIMTSQGSHGWLIGLVVSVVSLALAAVLWSSRRL